MPSRDHVLVLVKREGKGRQTPLWIGTNGGGAATAVNAIDGTAISAPQPDGGLLVSVSDSPVYVHLHGSLDPVIRSFLSLPDKLALLPGHDNPLRLQITNPTDHPASFSLAVTADSPAVQITQTTHSAPGRGTIDRAGDHRQAHRSLGGRGRDDGYHHRQPPPR